MFAVTTKTLTGKALTVHVDGDTTVEQVLAQQGLADTNFQIIHDNKAIKDRSVQIRTLVNDDTKTLLFYALFRLSCPSSCRCRNLKLKRKEEKKSFHITGSLLKRLRREADEVRAAGTPVFVNEAQRAVVFEMQVEKLCPFFKRKLYFRVGVPYDFPWKAYDEFCFLNEPFGHPCAADADKCVLLGNPKENSCAAVMQQSWTPAITVQRFMRDYLRPFLELPLEQMFDRADDDDELLASQFITDSTGFPFLRANLQFPFNDVAEMQKMRDTKGVSSVSLPQLYAFALIPKEQWPRFLFDASLEFERAFLAHDSNEHALAQFAASRIRVQRVQSVALAHLFPEQANLVLLRILRQLSGNFATDFECDALMQKEKAARRKILNKRH